MKQDDARLIRKAQGMMASLHEQVLSRQVSEAGFLLDIHALVGLCEKAPPPVAQCVHRFLAAVQADTSVRDRVPAVQYVTLPKGALKEDGIDDLKSHAADQKRFIKNAAFSTFSNKYKGKVDVDAVTKMVMRQWRVAVGRYDFQTTTTDVLRFLRAQYGDKIASLAMPNAAGQSGPQNRLGQPETDQPETDQPETDQPEPGQTSNPGELQGAGDAQNPAQLQGQEQAPGDEPGDEQPSNQNPNGIRTRPGQKASEMKKRSTGNDLSPDELDEAIKNLWSMILQSKTAGRQPDEALVRRRVGWIVESSRNNETLRAKAWDFVQKLRRNPVARSWTWLQQINLESRRARGYRLVEADPQEAPTLAGQAAQAPAVQSPASQTNAVMSRAQLMQLFTYVAKALLAANMVDVSRNGEATTDDHGMGQIAGSPEGSGERSQVAANLVRNRVLKDLLAKGDKDIAALTAEDQKVIASIAQQVRSNSTLEQYVRALNQTLGRTPASFAVSFLLLSSTSGYNTVRNRVINMKAATAAGGNLPAAAQQSLAALAKAIRNPTLDAAAKFLVQKAAPASTINAILAGLT